MERPKKLLFSDGMARHLAFLPFALNCALFSLAILLFSSVFCSYFQCSDSVGHAATSITQTTGAGNLGTEVLPPSGNVYGITGGKTVGTNLYHSFDQFTVGTGDIAQFQTPTLIQDPAMQNILGRITDQNPSTIFGTIDSATYYPSANLFLMNPHGFLFGPQATVNVGGMVAFTTANYLRLTDNVRFEAGPGGQDALLSTFPVAAFGFLGANPAAIAVHGSQLTVANGTGVSLVGGNQGFDSTNPDTGEIVSVPDGVTMTGGKLSAPSGQINIASVASAGEISTVDFLPSPAMTMGNISLSQEALLDVSADAAGTVRIRSGQLVIENAAISADTVNVDGAYVALDINVTEDVSISAVDVPAVTARATGPGNAGEVRISSQNLVVTASAADNFIFSVIDTHTSGSGKAGDVTIATTNNLKAISDNSGFIFFIDSGTVRLDGGHGGNVTLSAKNMEIDHANINTGDFVAAQTFEEAAGSGGNLTINADTLSLSFSGLSTDGFFGGRGGNLSILANDVQMNSSFLSTSGIISSGRIQIAAGNIVADASQIDATTLAEDGGDISFTGRMGQFSNGTTIQTSTFGEGNAGDITFAATERLTFSDNPTLDAAPLRPSGLFTSAIIGTGDAGSISVSTPLLELTGGARFDATTGSNGNGGQINIQADVISVSGERPFPPIEGPLFGLVTNLASGIYSRTVQSEFCVGLCGNAGPLSISTSSLNLNQGARVDSSTTSAGSGGDITINANQISIAGTTTDGISSGVFTTSSAEGAGGNISLTAGQSVTISDGAAVSASSTGSGNAGNIQIDAGNQFTMTNSSVTTEATQSGGGAIKITTNPSGTVHLTDSTISASVLNGAGGGGSVNIDPLFVILQNSQILANAVFGPGGNIFITTNLLLPDANSVISASSQFGQSGTVTIQSPNAPVSGQIHPLGKTPLLATSLFNQQCASVAGGQFSSFTVAGRNSLPTEPGSWLTSPIAMAGVEPKLKAEGGKAEGLSRLSGVSYVVRAWLAAHQINQTDQIDKTDQSPLSLRQIAPAGFLTRAFSVDEPAGCQS